MKKPRTRTMPSGYGMVQTAVLQLEGLSREAKLIYCLLASYTGAKDFCWPSQLTIAKNLGYKKADTVSPYIKELVEWGLVEKHKLYKDPKKRHNKYRIKYVDEHPRTEGYSDADPPPEGVGYPPQKGVSTPFHGGQNINKNNNKNINKCSCPVGSVYLHCPEHGKKAVEK